MLCRVLNALFSTPPLSRLAPAPRIDDRTDMGAFLRQILAEGTTFLDKFAPWHEVKGRTVLDVGCGLGARTAAVAIAGAAEVVGIDTDTEKIRWAQTLASMEGIDNVLFVVQSVSRAAFRENRFDLILLTDVIEHLTDPGAALSECARVLRPGGKILVAFPPYLSPWGAHLFGHIRIPWAHLLFPDHEVLETWRALHLGRAERGAVYCSEGRTRCIMGAKTVAELWDLNRMTIGGFLRLVQETELKTCMLRLKAPVGLGGFLRIPSAGLRERVVTRLVAVLER